MSHCTSVPGDRVILNDSFVEILKYFDAPEIPQKPAWEIALKIVFYIISIIGALVGNVLVMLVICVNKKMRTTTNVLIVNLALSDLMVAVFCMWVHLGNQLASVYPFGIMCRFATFVQVLSVTLSVLTLTGVSFERFLAIVFPLKGKMSMRGIYILVTVTWIISITIASPQLFVRKRFEMQFRNRKDIVCQESWPKYYIDTHCNSDEPGKKIYYTSVCVVMYIVPILVMLIAYGVILVKLTLRKIPGHATASLTASKEKTKKKVLKMLLVVVIIFVICWTPQQTLLLWDVYRSGDDQLPPYMVHLKYAAIYLAYFNSAINPVIYGGFNEHFRKGFKEALKCQLWKKSNRVFPSASSGRSAATANQLIVSTRSSEQST